MTASSNSNSNIKTTWKTNTKTRKIKMGRKIANGYFERQNLRDYARDDLDMAKEEKPQERKWISFYSNRK